MGFPGLYVTMSSLHQLLGHHPRLSSLAPWGQLVTKQTLDGDDDNGKEEHEDGALEVPDVGGRAEVPGRRRPGGGRALPVAP